MVAMDSTSASISIRAFSNDFPQDLHVKAVREELGAF